VGLITGLFKRENMADFVKIPLEDWYKICVMMGYYNAVITFGKNKTHYKENKKMQDEIPF